MAHRVAESEALRLYAALELIVAASTSSINPNAWVSASESIREISRAVSTDELLRKKLAIIPAMFPLLSHLLAAIKAFTTEIYTKDGLKALAATDCGYVAWQAADAITMLGTATFQVVRNLCAAVPEAQILACQSGIHKVLDGILTHFYCWLKRHPEKSCAGIKKSVYALIQMGTQTLANMMASNPVVQNKIWPRFFGESELLLLLLDTKDPKTVKYVLLYVYNCIYNDSARSSLLIQTAIGRKILNIILIQIDTESESTTLQFDDNFDLIYAIFKALITNLPPSNLFKALCFMKPSLQYQHLSTVTRAHVCFLKLADADMKAGNESALWDESFSSTAAACVLKVLTISLERFVDATTVPAIVNGQAAVVEGRVGADLEAIGLLLDYFALIVGDEGVSIESAARAGGGNAAQVMYKRRCSLVGAGLLDTVVKFLVVAAKLEPQNVRDTGKSEIVGASRLPEGSTVLDTIRTGLCMMKVNAMKVVSAATFECQQAQDEIRRVGGIPVILNYSTMDDENPTMKEWSAFALRTLCDGNVENQRFIESMEIAGASTSSE
ncbi:spinocerebellar ataxia type 10 protein domain-containing protein [Chytriomyces cf. hyalinus JEL632]|nr:spinocerebellar ataxia type 10 protein domain-containing protein [Chytriomyces cf. hyalinus JEL632]